MQKLFIDTDIGSEMTDAAAITLAASSSEVTLLGLTTVTGNTPFRAAAAARLLELLGQSTIPIAAGIGNLLKVPTWEVDAFGVTYDQESYHEDAAAGLIITTIKAHPHEVTLVGIGPLCNIARALDLCPELLQLTKRLVLMGGMLTPPLVDSVEVPRGFEYNFQQDVAASEKVLTAGFDLTIVPGDLTFQSESIWTEEEFTKIQVISHPAVRLLAELAEHSFGELQEILANGNFPPELVRRWINDEIAMMYVLQPELFETETLQFEWQLPDKYPRLVEVEQGSEATIVRTVKDFSVLRSAIIERLSLIA
jgi:inosine-uridine nucleoside N-ribohydrolase